MKNDKTPDLSIIICTFNRRDLLTKALHSIAGLKPANDLTFEVLVVDNSPDANALLFVEEYAKVAPFTLSAIAAQPANISVARNAGVAATNSAFVAFIDDDQELGAEWLIAVQDALATFPHDVFFGMVSPEYEDDALVDDTIDTMFSRVVDGPAGLDLFAMGRQKTPGVALGSGNTVLRRSTALCDPEPFDPAFGNSGGEDYDLFCRLQRRGKTLAWMPSAKVREFVPASRCAPDYMAARLFAGAQAFALAVSRNNQAPALERFRQRVIAIIQLLLLVPHILKTPFLDTKSQARLRYRRALVLGKLSFKNLRSVYLET